MKVPPHAFEAYFALHAWVGVVSGLGLHVVFLAGALALYEEPLAVWQEPRAHVAPAEGCASRDVEAAIAAALARSGLREAELARLAVTLPDERCRPLEVEWIADDGARGEALIDPTSGEAFAPRSDLAAFLFRLHFLTVPGVIDRGYYVAGLLAMGLALAIVTGLLVHLKDLARQLHRFRGGRARVVASDAHKVLGVVGAPFQLGFALTGALLCLGGLLLDAWSEPVFGGDRTRLEEIVYGALAPMSPTDRSALRLAVPALVERARAVLPEGSRATYVRIHHPEDKGATAVVYATVPGVLDGAARVHLAASDGWLLHLEAPSTERPTETALRWTYGLHYARYGGPLLRAVYALLALGCCATILSGCWIWILRRDPSRARRGTRVLERLTVAIGVGPLVATASLFVACRALPPELAERASIEQWIFLLAWLAVAVACATRAEVGALWAPLLSLAGGLALCAAASSVLVSGTLLDAGAPEVRAVDAALVASAALAWAIARAIERHRAGTTRAVSVGGGLADAS